MSNDNCEACDGLGYREITYAEAGRDPCGSNENAMEKAGEVCDRWECEECDGTGRGRCRACGEWTQEPNSDFCDDCE